MHILRKLKALCCLTGALMLSACSPVSLLNFTVPKSDFLLHKDIAYGEDPRQRLDIYIPKGLAKPAPVILFFYGGSWQTGSKKDYLFAGQAFASKGYIAVIADYRLYPQVYFPEFMHDSAAAFVWVHGHIAEYGGDTGALFLAGHSAGAYNAVMLAADTSYLRAAGGNESWIKGVIGISGPYDFLPFSDPKIIALFSKAPDAETQPVTYVHAGMPPLFLATGDDDTMVLPRNTHRMTDKLKKYHDPVETHIYPGLGHIGIALSLASGFHYKAPLLEDITRFVNENSGEAGHVKNQPFSR